MEQQKHVDKPLVLQPTCVHLRHKLMYVDDRHMQNGKVDTQSDTRVYWCGCTQDALGPDSNSAGPRSCNGSRSCFTKR